MSDQVQSTPAKGEQRSGRAKVTAGEERAILPLPKATVDFIKLFLSQDDLPDLPWLHDVVNSHLQSLYQAKSEHGTYAPIIRIMNRISIEAYKIYHKGIPSQTPRCGLPAKDPLLPAIVFVDSHKTNPPDDLFNTNVSPDILAYWCDVEDLMAYSPPVKLATTSEEMTADLTEGWSLVEAVLEAKPAKRDNSMQVVHYVDILMRYRPDKSRVLSLTSNQKSFAFYTADACGTNCSERFEWKTNIPHILRFIYTLYSRPHQDPSFPLDQPLLTERQPKWEFNFLNKRYRVSPFFARKGPGRRTWLAAGTQVGTKDFRVVKDMWRDVGRRYEEGALLDRIHAKGCVPGVVRVAEKGPILTDDRTPLKTRPIHYRDGGQAADNSLEVPSDALTREKQRLIMGSSGSRLSSCKTVLHFLKVMYDTLEGVYMFCLFFLFRLMFSFLVHQHLAELGVLHRDISWYNVLCNPKHYIGTNSQENRAGRHYIGEILCVTIIISDGSFRRILFPEAKCTPNLTA